MSPRPDALAELVENLDLIEQLRGRLLGGVEAELAKIGAQLAHIDQRLKSVEAGSSTRTPQPPPPPRGSLAAAAAALNWHAVALILGALVILANALTGRGDGAAAQTIAAEVARQLRAPATAPGTAP